MSTKRGAIELDKILFLFCNLFVFLGILLLFLTSLLNKVLPMVGYAAFQAAAAGSYSPDDYVMNFTVINIFAMALVISGVGIGYKLYKKGL